MPTGSTGDYQFLADLFKVSRPFGTTPPAPATQTYESPVDEDIPEQEQPPLKRYGKAGEGRVTPPDPRDFTGTGRIPDTNDAYEQKYWQYGRDAAQIGLTIDDIRRAILGKPQSSQRASHKLQYSQWKKRLHNVKQEPQRWFLAGYYGLVHEGELTLEQAMITVPRRQDLQWSARNPTYGYGYQWFMSKGDNDGNPYTTINLAEAAMYASARLRKRGFTAERMRDIRWNNISSSVDFLPYDMFEDTFLVWTYDEYGKEKPLSGTEKEQFERSLGRFLSTGNPRRNPDVDPEKAKKILQDYEEDTSFREYQSPSYRFRKLARGAWTAPAEYEKEGITSADVSEVLNHPSRYLPLLESKRLFFRTQYVYSMGTGQEQIALSLDEVVTGVARWLHDKGVTQQQIQRNIVWGRDGMLVYFPPSYRNWDDSVSLSKQTGETGGKSAPISSAERDFFEATLIKTLGEMYGARGWRNPDGRLPPVTRRVYDAFFKTLVSHLASVMGTREEMRVELEELEHMMDESLNELVDSGALTTRQTEAFAHWLMANQKQVSAILVKKLEEYWEEYHYYYPYPNNPKRRRR